MKGINYSEEKKGLQKMATLVLINSLYSIDIEDNIRISVPLGINYSKKQIRKIKQKHRKQHLDILEKRVSKEDYNKLRNPQKYFLEKKEYEAFINQLKSKYA